MSNSAEDVIKTLNISFSSGSSSNTNAQKDFGERLKTYIAEQKWVKRPLALSPATCSRYGWKCIKSNLLECVTCSAKLSAHEPQMQVYDTYKACLDKILTDLKESHRKHCPWPLTPCPENFVKMVHLPKEEALSGFLQRFKSSLLFESSVPEIKKSLPSELGLKEDHILSLCKLAGISSSEVDHFKKSVTVLAATGWTLTSNESEQKKVLISCSDCQRHTWSGSFSLLQSSILKDDHDTKSNEQTETNGCPNKPVEDNSEDKGNEPDISAANNSEKQEEEISEPPAKKKKFSFDIKKGEAFNPLYEHRLWCLWISMTSQMCNSDGKDTSSSNDKNEEMPQIPGWKVFIKSLLRNVSDPQDLSLENSPSKEKIRNVRNMLETWTDAFT